MVGSVSLKLKHLGVIEVRIKSKIFDGAWVSSGFLAFFDESILNKDVSIWTSFCEFQGVAGYNR